jgi:sugar/nucleoside kinase (ribokinase family)
VQVVGTTGSGDCTIAGFLAGLLRGEDVAGVLTSAVAVGACCCEVADSTSGIRPWADVQARLGAGWARGATTMRLDGWRHDETGGLWHGPDDA